MKTLHLIGSRSMGGAEGWFFRFTKELAYRVLVERGIRKGSDLCKIKDGVKTHRLFFKTVWDPVSKLQIKRLIKKVKPNIVQTYMGRATRLTHIKKKSNIVHIARIGGYYKLHAFLHAHAWIGNTKGICDYLINNGFPRNRVFLIYNFVDSPNLYPEEIIAKEKERLNISNEDFIILSLGRFVPVKGHEDLIKAFSVLKGSLKKKIKLLLLGDGPLKGKLIALSNSLNVHKDIVWLGWRNDPELFYQMCDIVVFPSLEMETFGNVILEAWAYEKPVVCTDFLGAQEIAEDEVDVLKAPCRNPYVLAEKIRMMIKNNEIRAFLVKNGKEKLEKRFSKDKIISRYLEVYNYLLERI